MKVFVAHKPTVESAIIVPKHIGIQVMVTH